MTFDLRVLVHLDTAVHTSAHLGVLDGVPTSEFAAYRADLDRFLTSPEYRSADVSRLTTADDFFTRTVAQGRGRTLSLFAQWMRQQRLGPWLPGGRHDDIVYRAAHFGRMGTVDQDHNAHDLRVELQQHIRQHITWYAERLTAWADAVPELRAGTGTVAGATTAGRVADLVVGVPGDSLLWLPEFAHWVVTTTADETVPQGDSEPVVARDPLDLAEYAPLTVADFEALTPDQWARYQSDVERFVPQSGFPWYSTGDVRAVLADPRFYLAPEYVLGRFVRAVIDGTFMPETPFPGRPAGTTTVPQGDTVTEGASPMTDEIRTFRERFAALPDGEAHGTSMRTTEQNVTRAFTALPPAVKGQWAELYNQGVADGRFMYANVRDFFRNDVATTNYGYSTENFFRWLKRDGYQIADDGSPVAPVAPVAPGSVPVFDVTVTPRALWADHVRLLGSVADLFREWTRLAGRGETWAEWMLGHRADLGDATFWQERGDAGVWSDQAQYLPSFLDWIRRPENAARIPGAGATSTTPTVPQGDSVTAPTAEPVIIPIGPEHPGFQAFAEDLARVATANGMCPEYDRIARQMGLPTRKTRIVTRITLDIPVDLERGHNVDDRTLREAAAALLAQSGSVSRANRTEISRTEVVAHGSGE